MKPVLAILCTLCLTLSATAQASATVFGSGCGSPPLTLSPATSAPPIIGTTAQVALSNAPSSLTFVAMGWSTIVSGAVPLPLPLFIFGMPDCYLLQSGESSGDPVAFTGPDTAVYGVAIPNWTGLIGLDAYLQAWANAPGANAGNTVTSNAVHWVIDRT